MNVAPGTESTSRAASVPVARIGLVVTLGAALAACVSPVRDGAYYQDDGPPRLGTGPDPASVPDAVPRAELLSRYGNAPYTALGKRFVPLQSAAGFRQTGYASWYGRKYHGRRTSSGETYDMYAMTAAHPVLPLPSYVRVRNLGNGRQAVVRVNDRGPFLKDRVIDLSYMAARKLGVVATGTARVEVVALAPGPAPLAGLPFMLQVGSFADASNARRLKERLERLGYDNVVVERVQAAARVHHRVRLGPYARERAARSAARSVEAYLESSVTIVRPPG